MELDDAYGQTFDRLRRMFRARGCSPEEAADLAQDAAVRAFMHIRRWGVTGAGLDPLLNRIARNLLIDRYRRVTPHVVPLDSADEIQDPAQDPSEEVARRQRRSAVHSAIRALPSRHQKAITYSMSGLSPEEVGKELGIGRNAADALLHRARRSLREHLAPVRDGMWGVAVMVRVRWDRLTRRVGVEGGINDAAHLVALQSGITVATAAVMGILSVAGANMQPPSASDLARARRVAVTNAATVNADSSSSAVSSPSTRGPEVGGGSGGGGSMRSSWGVGGLAGGSYGDDGSDTTLSGPRDRSGRPIFEITQHYYGTDDPPRGPVEKSLDRSRQTTCSKAPVVCKFWG